MAKRKYAFDEAKIERFHKEGRGEGHGADYKPWLTIHDIPSSGRCTRLSGWKTGRIHHLLSDNETGLFLLFDWTDDIVDIREQFPLDRAVTQQIAEQIGIPHPLETSTQTPLVMSTDFLVDIRRGEKIITVARTVKPIDKLEELRVIEKFEIERRYWEARDVDWGIVTDADLPTACIRNIMWVHDMRSFEHVVQPAPHYWDDRIAVLLDALPTAAGMSVGNFCRWLENTRGFKTGEGLSVIRHLIATKSLLIDMDRELDMAGPVVQLSMARCETGETGRVRA